MSKILRNLNRNKRLRITTWENRGLKSFLYDISSYHGVLAFKSSVLIIVHTSPSFKRWPFFSSSSVMQSNILKSLIFEKSILWEGPLLAFFTYIHTYIHIENPPGSIYLSGKQRVLESTYTYLYHTNIGFWASWLHIIHSL